LRTGQSPKFALTGAVYQDGEFRVTIGAAPGRIENVATLSAYSTKFIATSKKLELLNQFRISYVDKVIGKPIFISILSYRQGIFGAILLNFDDKGLTSQQRRKFNQDFEGDFGLPLNQFLIYDDLTEQAIYKHFLQTVSSRAIKVEMRSTKAMSIYSDLLADKLLVPGDIVEESSKVCVNSSCPKYFKRTWDTKKYCNHCSEILINGKSVEIRSIEEKNVSQFLKNTITFGNVTNVDKKILSRAVIVSQISHNNDRADFITISKPLNDNQIEILKFRYPHAILVTTHDNKGQIIAKGCQAITLWELIYSIKKENSQLVKRCIRQAKVHALANMRVLCATSISRVINDDFYKERNSEVKNLGAELFEADCSILFDYVFGNCLWLGAKYRGVSVPDGFTAFPMLQTTSGCFIWDGKFSEGKNLVMGNFTKNHKYISDARKNQSLKHNGGLKGFVFISNNNFPKSYESKYSKLTKGKQLKLSFIRAVQFQKITDHYLQNEVFINRNLRARNQFISSMTDLFFSRTKHKKCEIILDADIDKTIANDAVYFATLKAGRDLRV
jgi:hypothetical protein